MTKIALISFFLIIIHVASHYKSFKSNPIKMQVIYLDLALYDLEFYGSKPKF